MITQLRKFHSPEKLADIYSKPHDHSIYGRGHWVRVEVTKQIARDMALNYRANSVADLSCGNGAIAMSLGLEKTILGDFAAGYEHQGPLHETLPKISKVDLYICSETLEHVERPLSALKEIRSKSNFMVLSTPIENWKDTNAEHYWAWDREGVEGLLAESGWKPDVFLFLDTTVFGEPYKYGMWGCK